jgi:hypothetical protein
MISATACVMIAPSLAAPSGSIFPDDDPFAPHRNGEAHLSRGNLGASFSDCSWRLRHNTRPDRSTVGTLATFLDVISQISQMHPKQASLWDNWHAYRDVVHLIAAVIAVCFDMQTRNRQKPLGLKGFQDLLPARVICLVPDLILGVALTYRKYGLDRIAKGGTELMLDPETVWRIPENINVEPVEPPIRKILTDEIAVLNTRRAGNHGVANRLSDVFPSAPNYRTHFGCPSVGRVSWFNQKLGTTRLRAVQFYRTIDGKKWVETGRKWYEMSQSGIQISD